MLLWVFDDAEYQNVDIIKRNYISLVLRARIMLLLLINIIDGY